MDTMRHHSTCRQNELDFMLMETSAAVHSKAEIFTPGGRDHASWYVRAAPKVEFRSGTLLLLHVLHVQCHLSCPLMPP